MSSANGSETRLTVIGPMPPPINGQSIVMAQMVARFSQHFSQIQIADSSQGSAGGLAGAIAKTRRSLASAWAVRGSDVVYIAVKAGWGMWITAAAAMLARIAGSRVFLHHHSYAYIRERKSRMVALTRAAGPRAHHIVLSRSMASDLVRAMPEIKRVLVLGNAALIDANLLDLPIKEDSPELVLGHLSNLSVEKGIREVVSLAVALHRQGVRTRLIIGGPAVDAESNYHIDRAARELGDLFQYRGAISGIDKQRFFGEITHFVFPSRYVHEAVPLVLYEAMAAGVVCVATRQGSIAEQLQDSPCVLARSADSFVTDTEPVLFGRSSSAADSLKSRQAYLRALGESEAQLEALLRLIGSAAT